MSTSMRAPGQGIITLIAEATISDGVVVVQGAADDKCKLPAHVAEPAVLGIAKVEGGGTVATGLGVDVVTRGVWPAVAAGTITRGDRVAIANTSGGVKSANYGVNASRIVGIALESAVSGERVAVLVMVGAMTNLVIQRMTAGAAIVANTAVKVGAADDKVITATTDPTSGLVGVALNAASADGDIVYVCTHGVVPVVSQGNTTRGNNLTIGDTAGGVKPASPATGANAQLLGVAMSSATAPATTNVLVNVCMMQGA